MSRAKGRLLLHSRIDPAAFPDAPFAPMPAAKASSLADTRVGYCGDNLDQLAKENRTFEDRHESTRAYIDYMRPRCVELDRGK